MRTIQKILGITSLLLLLLTPLTSEGADWEYLLQDDRGDSHYIDLESIKQTASGTSRIVRKVESKGTSSYNSLVTEIEINCKENKIRVLKETRLNKKGKNRTTKKNGEWITVNPEDRDEFLLELVCSLKKSS